MSANLEAVICGSTITVDDAPKTPGKSGWSYINIKPSVRENIECVLVFDPCYQGGEFMSASFAVDDAALAGRITRLGARISFDTRFKELTVPVKENRVWLRLASKASSITSTCVGHEKLTLSTINDIAPRGSTVRAVVKIDTIMVSDKGAASLRVEVVAFSVIRKGEIAPRVDASEMSFLSAPQ